LECVVPQAAEILSRTPKVLRAILDGATDSWARSHYGDKTFSPFDVVGHLILGEQKDWIPRMQIILRHGPATPFDPFDRYAMFEADKGKDMGELLDTFDQLRRENLKTLNELDLSEADLNLQGTHPELGAVTLRQLLAAWVAHDLNHIAQICKAMAFQYANEVGPWRAYLSILKPPIFL